MPQFWYPRGSLWFRGGTEVWRDEAQVQLPSLAKGGLIPSSQGMKREQDTSWSMISIADEKAEGLE